MATPEMHAVNIAAYDRVRDELPDRYPHLHCIAFHEGEPIADAPDLHALLEKIRQLGLYPPDCLAVRVGEEWPDHAGFIFIHPEYAGTA